MNNSEFNNLYINENACNSRGACSAAPNIIALQALIMTFIKLSCHYIIKLKNEGASNSDIKLKLLNDIARLVSLNEFSEAQMYDITLRNYYLLKNVIGEYINFFKDKNTKEEIKWNYDFCEKTPIHKAISIGEKILRDNATTLKSEIRNLHEIMFILIKNVCFNLANLYDFGIWEESVFCYIIRSINIYNSSSATFESLKSRIDKLSILNTTLQKKISSEFFKTFGHIKQTEVSHSTTKGKAILISGSNFFDLKQILELTKNTNIDIYTHSNLLLAHSLESFQQYKNLKGHYGDLTESCILDFATFQGGILLTKNSQLSEYLYRGKLFSNDYIIHKGVTQIEKNNFHPLIEAAMNSKGFTKEKIKPSTQLGFDKKELIAKFDEIISRIKDQSLKRLYIVFPFNRTDKDLEYFSEFAQYLNKQEYLISFSPLKENKRILTINVGDYAFVITAITEKILSALNSYHKNITFFFPRCNPSSLSNIIYLKSINFDDIYISQCSPTTINPNAFAQYTELYKILIMNDAYQDLSITRKKSEDL